MSIIINKYNNHIEEMRGNCISEGNNKLFRDRIMKSSMPNYVAREMCSLLKWIIDDYEEIDWNYAYRNNREEFKIFLKIHIEERIYGIEFNSKNILLFKTSHDVFNSAFLVNDEDFLNPDYSYRKFDLLYPHTKEELKGFLTFISCKLL